MILHDRSIPLWANGTQDIVAADSLLAAVYRVACSSLLAFPALLLDSEFVEFQCAWLG